MKNLFCILFVLSILSSSAYSQIESANPRINRPITATIGTGDYHYSLIDLQFGYFLNQNLEPIIRTSGENSIAAGLNYHFNTTASTNPFTPFVGLQLGLFETEPAAFIPVGFRYMGKRGFTASTALSWYVYDFSRAGLKSLIDIRIGWCFDIQ